MTQELMSIDRQANHAQIRRLFGALKHKHLPRAWRDKKLLHGMKDRPRKKTIVHEMIRCSELTRAAFPKISYSPQIIVEWSSGNESLKRSCIKGM